MVIKTLSIWNQKSFQILVRKGGFEPPRLSAPPPQDGVSASSTTSALGLFAPTSAETPDGRKRKLDYNKLRFPDLEAKIALSRPLTAWSIASIATFWLDEGRSYFKFISGMLLNAILGGAASRTL